MYIFSLDSFKMGDPDAFAYIYSHLYNDLALSIRRMYPWFPLEDCEDITSKGMVRVYFLRDMFREYAHIRQYLFAYVKGAARNQMRSQQLHKKSDRLYMEMIQEAEVRHTAERMQLQSDSQELRRRISVLPDALQTILSLTYVRDLTNEEIATVTGWNDGQIRKYRSRGEAFLKKMYSISSCPSLYSQIKRLLEEKLDAASISSMLLPSNSLYDQKVNRGAILAIQKYRERYN